LLDNPFQVADIEIPHKISSALSIHFAGHSGSVLTAKILLDKQPNHLNAVWDLNGHTILLQAAFYGHLELAEFLLKKGANTAITTARGLGPMEMAKQFQNNALVEIISPYDSSSIDKATYYKSYLNRIAPIIPDDEFAEQEKSDQLFELIDQGIKAVCVSPESGQKKLEEVISFIDIKKVNVNRWGGPLQQPPLVVVVTGNNGIPEISAVANLRFQLAKYLLEKGADPTLKEKHPMNAHSIIRASVFNHLEILKLCEKFITPQQLADALNDIPIPNGLTALHDSVLRTTTAGPDRVEKYLEQVRWCMAKGAKSNIEDFSGITQKNIAENAKDIIIRERLLEIL
jgi:ankyrin repeat protein